MKEFRPLTVERIDRESRDSVRIALSAPVEIRGDYAFRPGQHLPFQISVDGKKLRRTYSICSEQDVWPLEIGVRIQDGGQFSEYAANSLKVGDTLDAMPPSGRFYVEPDEENAKDYVGFAAGSGITPILSMVKSVLAKEPNSRFLLFYGNRKQATTMFIEDLFALKNQYPERLQLQFVFSQEEQELPILEGRLDGQKVRELYQHFGRGLRTAAVFVCGPDSMIKDVTETVIDLGLDESKVHSERFGVPRKGSPSSAAATATTAAHATVTVIMDGHKKSFEMQHDDDNIVDAAADSGIDLPYSCKGGVCATCRCHVREGEVTMATNFGLEPWELDKGFVLACQSRPISDTITLDYDKA